MKKLLLILLCPILLLTSCSKSGVTPQSLESVIVGKKWILNNDVNGFYLSQNGGFYSTEVCGEDVQQGNWIIEDDLIKYRYYLNNSQEVTILYGQVSEYTSTQIKLVDSSDPNMTVNTVYNAFTEIYGCTDAAADNYNEDANCDDGSCNYCINNDCTYVPDDNFEAYLEANGMGDGIAFNDYVTTSNINGVTHLVVDNIIVNDMTGIEDFISLTSLEVDANEFSNLDLSNNTALTYLNLMHHTLSELDLSNNTALVSLVLNGDMTEFSQLTSLDVSMLTDLISLTFTYSSISDIDLSNNTALTYLDCNFNQLTSLDVSNNTNLTTLWCGMNQLASLDLRNGNNPNFSGFYCGINNNLNCISVDDSVWSTANWTNIDPHHYFSEDCSTK
jgi:Leucine-rich repeat (LRR) protein